MALSNILAPRQQQKTAAGAVLSGGKVFLFEPGTTTFIASFRDSGLVQPHTNPVRLSGSGRANIWITRDCDMFITDRNNQSDVIPSNIAVTELRANPDALGVDEAGGLVPNGSFEIDVDADTVPDSWTLVSEAGATNAIDTAESTDGAQSFRFTSSGNGGGSLTTTGFFPVNDVDTLRVNVDLRSTVAAVRNIVRVEWYDISQVLISNSDAYDSTANPAVFTTQNLAINPPLLARFAKLRLIGIDPTVLLAGSTFFDRVSVFYPAVVSGVFDNITIQNNEIITTNLNGDLNITPNGTGQTLIKNPRVLTDINTATPPIAEAVTGSYQIRDADNTDLLAEIGYTGSAVLRMRSRMHGAPVSIDGEDNAGVVQAIFIGDPDGETGLYNNGTRRFSCATNGVVKVLSDGNTDAESRRLDFVHQDDTLRGLLGYVTSDNLELQNRINSGSLKLSAWNAGGVQRSILDADPDAGVEISHPAGNVVRVTTSADALKVKSDGNTDTETRSLRFAHQDGTDRAFFGHSVGPNILLRNQINGGDVLIEATDAGGVIRTILTGDPDGSTILRNAGNDRLAIGLTDVVIRRDDNIDTSALRLRFAHDDLTARALLGFNGSADLVLRNEVHGGPVSIQAEDAGGVARTILTADPDAVTILRGDTDLDLQVAAGETAFYGTANGKAAMYFNNIEAARSLAASAGGLEANNTLTGAGFERVLTVADKPDLKVKTVDEAVVSSIGLQTDDELSGWNLAADTRYIVEGFIKFTHGAGDFQLRWVVSELTGVSGVIYSAGDSASASFVDVGNLIGLFQFITLSGSNNALTFKGFIHSNAANPSVLDFQWAQQSSDVAATTVREGSWVRVTLEP